MKTRKTKRINEIGYGCPIEAALTIIGNKWKGVILYHLHGGYKRFNELKRLIPHVSQRILTLQLRELEADKVINRKVYAEVPPKVEYSLSSLGTELTPVLAALQDWGQQFMAPPEKEKPLSE